MCEHKAIRKYCRDCLRAGTGGNWLCVHAKRKVHCKECKGNRLCKHNKLVRLCKYCGEVGQCPHGKEKSACTVCRKEEKCRHKKRRHTCTVCKDIRSNPIEMAHKVHELLNFLSKEHFPGPSNPNTNLSHKSWTT